MATSKTSEAKAKISLDSASFEKGAKAVTNAANAMSKAVTVALAAAGTAILAALGAQTVSGILKSVKGILDLGESMANAGKRAGLAAGQFYLFHNAVEKGLSLKTVAGLLGDNAEVLNRSASVFRDVSIKLWAVGEKIRGFWLGLMDRVAPVLSRILDGALGASLVSAGEWFGEKIADAVEIVYELAKDGMLWQTLKQGLEIAFNYAGERVAWLAKTLGDVLQAVTSAAFACGVTEGVNKARGAIQDFTTETGINIAIAFASAFATVVDIVDGLIDRIKNSISDLAKYLNPFAAGGNPAVADTKDAASGAIGSVVSGLLNALSKTGGTNNESFSDTIAKALKGAIPEFKQSDSLGTTIADFTKTIADTLPKYKAEEKSSPSTKFENNTRRAAFGADSLTSIGGGGGVYLGLSVLDVNKAQLNELRQINQKLSNLGGSSSSSVTNLSYSPDISRAQTSAVVNN